MSYVNPQADHGFSPESGELPVPQPRPASLSGLCATGRESRGGLPCCPIVDVSPTVREGYGLGNYGTALDLGIASDLNGVGMRVVVSNLGRGGRGSAGPASPDWCGGPPMLDDHLDGVSS